jgi:hypothetical protein
MVDASIQDRDGARVQFRGGGFEPVSRKWVSWVFFAVLLLVWELASRVGLIDSLFLPAPSQIWKALEEMTLSGELAKHLGASLVRIGAGWLIGTAAGVVLGGLIGLSWLGRSAGLPFISALFPVPKIALLPLLILWFGIGEASRSRPSRSACSSRWLSPPMRASTTCSATSSAWRRASTCRFPTSF